MLFNSISPNKSTQLTARSPLKRLFAYGTATVLALSLLACGGGGGSGSSADVAAGTSDTSGLVSPSRPESFSAAPSGTSSSNISGGTNLSQNEIDVLNRVNQIRGLAGLGAVNAQFQLNNAAQKHTAYQLETSQFGHVENTSTAANFTGRTLADRVNYQTYSWNRLLEVTAASRPVQSGVVLHDLLIDAIYHRLGMLRHDLVDAGVGYSAPSTTSVLTIVYGRPASMALAPSSSAPIVVWPIPSQTNVPPTFASDTESPDPVPGQNIVGYPVSLQVYPGISLTTMRFRIFEVASTGETEITNTKLLTSTTDSNVDDFCVAVIPLSPLKSATVYRVQFDGQIGGTTRSLTWQFTTF